MSNVVPIEDGIKEWYSGYGKCIFCGDRHIMVAPAKLTYCECPSCGCMSVRKDNDAQP